MTALSFAVSVMLSLATPAAAQDALTRFEGASETIGAEMNRLMAEEYPAIADNLPETEWDDAHRTAGTCILTTLIDEAGVDYVAGMLAGLEATAKRRFSSTAELSTAASFPSSPNVSTARVQTITEDCGLTALAMQRMVEAGTFEALQGN